MIFYITFLYIIILNLKNNRCLNILVLNIFLLSCLCYYFFTYSLNKKGREKKIGITWWFQLGIHKYAHRTMKFRCCHAKIQNIFFSDTFHLSTSTSHVQQESCCIIFCSLSRTPDMSNEIVL